MKETRTHRFRIAVLVAASAVLGALAAGAGSAAAATSPRTITVNGTGIVKSVPDQADFTFGVSTNAATATGALRANAKKMTEVIAALKAQGIADRDLQTAQISITPNTNQSGSTVLNYTATNSVTARTKSIATSGKIIDEVVRVGANLVGGPSLTQSDQQALSRTALKAAIADARARAQVIAAAAHVKLGRVRTVAESGNNPITATPVEAKSFATTPVEPGTVQTQAELTVTFDIA